MFHLWITILAAVIAIAYNVFRYIHNHRNYWKRRNVIGPEPSFWFGNLKELIRPEYPAPLQIRDWTKEYGKVYGIQEGWPSTLVISDLDMMQDLFVKKFEQFYGRKTLPFIGNVDKDKDVHVFAARGLRWKRLRTLSNPVFSVNSLRKIKHTVEDSVNVMVGYLEENADTEKSFNIHLYYQQLTMDVIARIAMGYKESQQFRNEYFDLVKAMFERPANHPFAVAFNALPPIFASIVRYLAIRTAKMRSMPFPFLKEQIEKAVNERRKMRSENSGKGEATDFIDLFLDAEADVDLSTTGYDRSNVKVERKLTSSEIVMQCFVFLLAGFDTTANSLAYVSYCIAKNAEVRKRIQDEIDEICVDEEVSYEQIQRLKYLDMVVKESLRLYPVAAFASSRTCMQTTKLGDVEIEKGVCVIADVFSVHYDKKIWGEDADEFRPERWENLQRHPLSWLPFGAGPRTCIGKKLADMEEKLALVHILRKYDIVAAPDTEKVLNLKGSATIAPESVTVRLKTREL